MAKVDFYYKGKFLDSCDSDYIDSDALYDLIQEDDKAATQILNYINSLGDPVFPVSDKDWKTPETDINKVNRNELYNEFMTELGYRLVDGELYFIEGDFEIFTDEEDLDESYMRESKGNDPYEIIKLNKDHYIQRLSDEWEGTPKSSWEDIFESVFDEFTRYADDEVSDFILDKFDNGEITADDVDAEFDNFLTFWVDDINEYDIFDEGCGSRKKSKKKKIVNQGCGSKKITDESAGVPSESQFVNAYTWSYGTTKAKAKQVYKDCKKDGDIEYIKAIVDGFEGNAKKSFYNDSKKPKKIAKESGKRKYTQRDIKDYVAKGMATDITHYSFDEANKFYKDHNYDVVGISHGTYGMNGALLQDVDTGEYFAITARNSILFQLV